MKKDDDATIPSTMKSLIVGLGWECPGEIDLDASIICLDSNRNKTGIVNFKNLEEPGITHSGDNTTGAGEGDDEVIRIDLDEIPESTVDLFVTVNIYTENTTFN